MKPTTAKRMEKENVKPKKSAAAKTNATAQPQLATADSPSATTAPASTTAVEHRNNPRIDEKIDEWIKRNPDQFKFFNEMPHERAVRKLILNEVEKYERQQKAKSYRQQEQGGEKTAPRYDRSQSNGMRAR